MTAPETYNARTPKAAVGHGIMNYWFRVLTTGLGHTPLKGDVLAMIVRRRVYDKERDEYRSITNIPKEKFPEILDEIKKNIKNMDEDERRAVLAMTPKIIRSAQILEDVTVKHPKGPMAYEKFADLISQPNPVRIVKRYIKDPKLREELFENLYKLHVQFARTIPEFFEDDSEIKYVVPRDKIEKWRKEAIRELEGLEEEKKQQAAGRTVATFEERALAEEFASLKGGRVVQTPEGKYAVILGESVKPQHN